MSTLLVKFFLVAALLTLGMGHNHKPINGTTLPVTTLPTTTTPFRFRGSGTRPPGTSPFSGGGGSTLPDTTPFSGGGGTTTTTLPTTTPVSGGGKGCVYERDPWDTRKCWPRPWWLWPDRYISHLRPIRYCHKWPWVKALEVTKKMSKRSEEAKQSLRNIPKSLQEDTSEDEIDRESRDLEIAEQLRYDWREYYWKLSCPYRLYYLGKFWHRHLRWCWIVSAHWKQKTQYAVCRRKYCNTRCKWFYVIRPQSFSSKIWPRNSLCLGANYRYYRRLLYCPWARRSCRKRPWRCFFWRTIKLPQCCECWHCWYMGVTRVLNDAKTSEETKAKMFVIGEGDEEGEGNESQKEPDQSSFMPNDGEEPPEEPPPPTTPPLPIPQ